MLDSTQGERDAAWFSVAQQLQQGGRDNPRLTEAVRAWCTISDDVDFMPSMVSRIGMPAMTLCYSAAQSGHVGAVELLLAR